MKKILIFLLFILFPINCFALPINSKALVARDLESNRIFFDVNKNNPSLIASTTKIMTAILAIESNRLEEIVPVGDEVLKAYGSNIYIENKEQLVLLDLVYGLMLRSGNDASLAIANFIGGSVDKFVTMMNKKAKELKMFDTNFQNPNGLDDDTKNYSSANDMVKLLSYCSKNKKFIEITGTKNYKTESNLKSYSWTNRCELLFNYGNLISCKTGYTPLAGRVLATIATKNNMKIGVFSINNSYDYKIHKDIYENIFNNYKKYLVLDKNKIEITNKNYNGKAYIKENHYYPLSIDEYNDLNYKVEIFGKNKIKNNFVGYIYAYLNNYLIAKEKLYINNYKKTFVQWLKDLF